MKDFKKMPKMACGGGVGKYNAGGDIEATKDRTKPNMRIVRQGYADTPVYAPPVEMPSRLGAAKQSENTPVNMPSNLGGAKRTVNLPGFGEVDRDKVQARKTGGKVKRGNKK